MLPGRMPLRHSRYGNLLRFEYILTRVTPQDVGHSDEARELLVGLLVGNLKSSVCPQTPFCKPVNFANKPEL